MNLREKIRKRIVDKIVIPANHRTNSQWAEIWKCSEREARITIREGISLRMMKKAIHRVPLMDGRIMTLPHYYET